ncbi:hypothetical protein VB773_02960 [Haloarculaceae archaeon H-GB2-1]|nr:hypothetical protein [Haloarculaceae archaeon H-GB1-1]MEA5406643.1 hypothetical protein [Haloarculaceae archaeon H-GB2-1]
MARHTFGWFGWISALGFVVLGALWLLESMYTLAWPVSATWTLSIAVVAGLGALALYFGNDPTAREPNAVT